jgi:NADPH-dependent glutamate synthase beta subunit-like oxidoreductase
MPAIGQEPELSVLSGTDRLNVSKYNTIEVNPDTLHSGIEGIFVGGDVVSGPNSVTAAMAQGKIAAKMVHKYVQELPVEREYKVTRPAIQIAAVELTDKEIEEQQKPSMPLLSLEERSGNFKEVELGFTKEMAVKEAKRCLRCDLELEEEGTTS